MSAQHAVIVGGSSGIGLATASQLLAMGYKVTIAARSGDRLEAAKKQLNGDVDTRVIDAADAASLPAAFASIGPFDHLILALGSGKGVGPFATLPLSNVREGFEEKVFAHFGAAQAALPFLRKDGSLTFVSAVSAHVAAPGTSGIGAANAAVAALAPILAAELRPLRVNAVSPGVIDTPWWDFLDAQQKAEAFAQWGGRSLVGRVGAAAEAAQAIAFLVSNGFMSGETIICDGGLRWAA